MKVRRIVTNENGTKSVVWFGSYGRSNDGHSKFFNDEDKHDNFAERQDAVANALTQKLNLLQGELWWNVSFGLPLMQNLKSKSAMDAAVAQIVMSQSGVQEIVVFSSSLTGHSYSAHIEVQTIYGRASLDV